MSKWGQQLTDPGEMSLQMQVTERCAAQLGSPEPPFSRHMTYISACTRPNTFGKWGVTLGDPKCILGY